MGKSTSKIIQTLALPLQPIRYLVTNTERIILVTYDYKFAKRIENDIKKLSDPRKFYVRLGIALNNAMIIFANGCSWTYGGSLEDYFVKDNYLDNELRKSLVWPYHLGNLFNTDKVYNLAQGCGSNMRSLRTTRDWLSNQNSVGLQNTVAVIQFTEWSRFEIYRQLDKRNTFENIWEYWMKCKIDTAIYSGSGITAPKDIDDLIDLVNRRIDMSSPIEWIYNVIGLLYSFKGLFESYGVKKYYFWQLGALWNNWPDEYKQELRKSFNILDLDVNGWEYERISTRDTHPNINGHKQIAQIIYDKIK